MVKAPIRKEAAKQIPPWPRDFATTQNQAAEHESEVGGNQYESEGGGRGHALVSMKCQPAAKLR